MQASTQALNLSQPQAVAANSSLNLRLPSPFQLKQQLPLSSALGGQVERHRQAVKAILDGEDDRLLVIVGPCSLHDPTLPSNTPNAWLPSPARLMTSCCW